MFFEKKKQTETFLIIYKQFKKALTGASEIK